MVVEHSPIKEARDGQLFGVAHAEAMPEGFVDLGQYSFDECLSGHCHEVEAWMQDLEAYRYGQENGSISSTETVLPAFQIVTPEIENLDGIVPWYDEFARPGDTRTAESMKKVPSEFPDHRYHTAGDQGPSGDRAVNELYEFSERPGLAKTCAVHFRNVLNFDLLFWKMWLDASTNSHVVDKVKAVLFRGPNIGSNGFLKGASKLAVCMTLFGNIPAGGAVRVMAPEAAGAGSLQAEGFEKTSNFAFGVVACAGTLCAVIALLKSFNWRKRRSVAGTSAGPAGPNLDRAVNVNVNVLRSWREREYREVLVALHEEKGAYAS